jgi:hypothetical protein
MTIADPDSFRIVLVPGSIVRAARPSLSCDTVLAERIEPAGRCGSGFAGSVLQLMTCIGR